MNYGIDKDGNRLIEGKDFTINGGTVTFNRPVCLKEFHTERQYKPNREERRRQSKC